MAPSVVPCTRRTSTAATRRKETCHYTWRGIYEDQTSRYSTADGWQTKYMSESGHCAADWRTAPKVCVDQNNEPDACGSEGYINP